MPKLRQNIITGDWVVISPERSKRPEDYVTAASPKRGLPSECPFCVENKQAYETSIKDAETENTYTITNKYPAFVKEDSVISEGDGFYQDTKSIGAHEVIIIKGHDQEIYGDGVAIMDELLGVYKQRYLHYDEDPVNEYTMIIHNNGPEAGASIDHPHSQLFTSAIMPSYVQKELDGAKTYFDLNQKCVFCEMVKMEKENGHRVVYENDEFLVFTFFASRFPFEMWVLPKKHASNFEKISAETQKQLAQALHEAIGKLNKALNFPPFNYWLHTLPHHSENNHESYHWHIEIAPRVSKFGGYELGSGVVIDVVAPEAAAGFLKKA
ncbi:MAG: galactose-1-phosphate uridylyltransferase [Candidatus Berkelbacteria bacterium]